MANIIKIKNSSVAAKVPVTGDLAYGEIALNYADGKIYYKKSDNTIQSISGGVASVSGTAPVVSSGGATPAISMPQATSSVSGYLSNSDWFTFNSKQNSLGFTPENTANKGAANGYAPLGANSKVSSTYLPNYVLEYANLAALPATGATGVLYVLTDTNKIYRWSGSAYIQVSVSPSSTDALFEGFSNLYYTDARARAAISATQNISYNSSTGVITGPVLSGYLTAETDTLATVTARGATTSVPITVAGQIESTTTGFKFPDGTTQATAATGANWTKITSATTATTKKQYVTDTTAGAFTVTLPATPAAGDYVYFMDAGNWATNNLTIARNGSTIEASATDLVLDVRGLMVQLIYDGTTWQVASNIGPQGPVGPAQGVGKVIAMAMIFGG